MKAWHDQGEWESILSTKAASARQPDRAPLIAQELIATRQAGTIVAARRGRGIETVLLKGVAFWTYLYPLGCRPVCDIDLLVQKGDVAGAIHTLTGYGYSHWRNHQRPISSRESYQQKLYPPAGQGLPVELHQSLGHSSRYFFDIEGLFSRAVSCTLHDVDALRLCDEDALLSLAIHRSKHGFDRVFKNTEDARRILDRRSIDWMVLRKRAEQWGCQTVLWLFLSGASVQAGPTAENALKAMEPGVVRRAYASLTLQPERNDRVFRWDGVGSLMQRLAVFPLLMDTSRQYGRFVTSYSAKRVADFFSWRRRGRQC